MKTKAYSVYDSKAKMYLKPIYSRNSAEAIRDFELEVNNPESKLNRFAADFTLFEIGEYDDETGLLTSSGTHINLGNALQFIKEQNVKNISSISQ